MVEEGVEVFVAAFSIARKSVPEGAAKDILKTEFCRAVPVLGVSPGNLMVFDYPVRRFSDNRQEILDELIRLRREIAPDLVTLPCAGDVHQDHQVMHAEGVRAFKGSSSVLGYELPWNQLTSSANLFVVLEKRHLERKWEALQQYRSQFQLNRPYFTKAYVEGLAKVRGVQASAEWAEAFEVLKIRW